MKVIASNDLLKRDALNQLVGRILDCCGLDEEAVRCIKIYENGYGSLRTKYNKSYFEYEGDTVEIIATKILLKKEAADNKVKPNTTKKTGKDYMDKVIDLINNDYPLTIQDLLKDENLFKCFESSNGNLYKVDIDNGFVVVVRALTGEDIMNEYHLSTLFDLRFAPCTLR